MKIGRALTTAVKILLLFVSGRPTPEFLNVFMFQHSNINELVHVPELQYK
jgi:hypothetical protein